MAPTTVAPRRPLDAEAGDAHWRSSNAGTAGHQTLVQTVGAGTIAVDPEHRERGPRLPHQSRDDMNVWPRPRSIMVWPVPIWPSAWLPRHDLVRRSSAVRGRESRRLIHRRGLTAPAEALAPGLAFRQRKSTDARHIREDRPSRQQYAASVSTTHPRNRRAVLAVPPCVAVRAAPDRRCLAAMSRVINLHRPTAVAGIPTRRTSPRFGGKREA
jgi:hypothetical protein